MAEPMPILNLTDEMLRKGDPPPLPAPGSKPPYVAREVRILTVSSGGYAVVQGTTIIGVAEAEGRLQTLVSHWAKGV